MKTVPIADVEAHFSAYLEQSQTEGPIVITQNGKAVAVLLTPLDEEDLQRLVLGRSSRFQALLDRSRQSIRAGRGLSRDAFWEMAEQRHREKEGGNQG